MKLTDLAPPSVASASVVGHAGDKFPESDLLFYRKLGRTDLTVSCLGLGGVFRRGVGHGRLTLALRRG